ncbi:MAG: sigma-70 family RNA polymerase sigma factor [Planctomycetota bacterium]
MAEQQPDAITELLAAAGQGEVCAKNQLWALVYDELHRVAQRQMAREGSGHTLQTTALVNEAYLRLVGDQDIHWNSRRHFFAAAANAMRRICIDYARQRGSLKRGAGARPEPFEDGPGICHNDLAEVLAVDEALEKLRQQDPRKAEVVMLRYFAGLNVDETAQALELGPRTVESDWRFARLWLYNELSKGDTAAEQQEDAKDH